MATLSGDGLVHHWAQGPQDVTLLYAPITYFERNWTHQFTWCLEDTQAVKAMGKAGRDNLRYAVNYTLNLHGQSWSRSGVYFSEVQDREKAHIILRVSDDKVLGPDGLAWAAGWYYHEHGDAIAQITAQPERLGGYSAFYPGFAYVLGMEIAGHGCFRMHDMYTLPHIPYTGAMGGWDEAMKSQGYPTQLEIDCAKAWLAGTAAHVHDHG